MLKTIAVRSKQEWREFMEFPNILYKDDPCYVPALWRQQKMLFNKAKYPLFEHSEAEFFIASRNGQTAGRIAAIIHRNHLQVAGDDTGFFGFFESVNDPEVASSLFDAAVEYCRKNNLRRIIGPENYSTNEMCGALIEGFNIPPVVMMPYNKAYYPGLYEGYGFTKTLDLFSYRVAPNDSFRRIHEISGRVERNLARNGVIIRNLDEKRLKEEVSSLRIAYNNAFRYNWGYVPITEKEFDYYAKEILSISHRDLIVFAEADSRIIGFIVAIFDANQLLIRIKEGRLNIPGLWNLLLYRNKINQGRILIAGVEKEYRNRGIDLCLYSRIFVNVASHGIKSVEAAYVMDNNYVLKSILHKLEGEAIKKYRLYQLTF